MTSEHQLFAKVRAAARRAPPAIPRPVDGRSRVLAGVPTVHPVTILAEAYRRADAARNEPWRRIV